MSEGTFAKWLNEKRLTHVKIMCNQVQSDPTPCKSLILKGYRIGSNPLQTLDPLSFGEVMVRASQSDSEW